MIGVLGKLFLCGDLSGNSRQRQKKGRSLPLGALYHYLSAMRRHNLLDNVQP